MSITITSKDKEQLALIKRMREYMQDRTPEQLNRMPKDKNGFIDFHLIFKRVDEVKEGIKEFAGKIEAYNLGDESIQQFIFKDSQFKLK